VSKPLNENIRAVQIVTDDGELLPVLDHAGSKFADLINAVTGTGKGGSLTLKIEVKPSTAGALAVKASVAVKAPQGKPAESLLWPTPEGNLMAEDPRQSNLDLKPVAAEPARELKTITA
jgi:hypothetical protein